MINLELPNSVLSVEKMTHMVAENVFRPISRKYDKKEHAQPVELNVLADMIKAQRAQGGGGGGKSSGGGNKNGENLRGVVSSTEMSWGVVGMGVSIPGIGLGNAAIMAVGTDEQKAKFGTKWCAMAITEPGAGSDTANISTTARLEGNEWVLNGTKIFVTAGQWCEAVVVWATLDKSLGKRAIKSFVVEKGTPGMTVARLEEKLGFRVSDTAQIQLDNCRIPRENILGSEEIASDAKKALGGVMQTFDNTRPMVAGMSVGVARAALEVTRDILAKEGVQATYQKSLYRLSAIEAELVKMEADWEAARLLMLKAAWMADNKLPNSKEAAMCKAKAGRVGNYITLRCVELCQQLGFSEEHLLEKWARDSKILDIFEGTQQIQQLIVARQVLGKSSTELK
ncbi:MAG TPA: acyl-CoA dehydrogenase family protein [Pseudomonadales bacterium]|nr:acyl-CoA dehydrogenase family protein [Pseudomonadales bacterium]